MKQSRQKNEEVAANFFIFLSHIFLSALLHFSVWSLALDN